MALIPTSPPALEPLSLAEAKAHLRIDHTLEDTLIQSLIQAARVHLELVLGQAFVTQGWTLVRDAWPRTREIELPLAPVLAVESIAILPASGAPEVLPAQSYVADAPGRRIVLQRDAALPKPGRLIAGIEIAFTAGYGPAAADVPQPLRQAMLLLIAHWHECRQPVEVGSPGEPHPLMVEELVAPYQRRRL